jgi:hypothetical protein
MQALHQVALAPAVLCNLNQLVEIWIIVTALVMLLNAAAVLADDLWMCELRVVQNPSCAVATSSSCMHPWTTLLSSHPGTLCGLAIASDPMINFTVTHAHTHASCKLPPCGPKSF